MGKTIDGWSRYEVEKDGTIRNKITGHVLKPSIGRTGYATVDLFADGGKHKRLLVHRLVAEAYLSNPNNLPCVNHKDETRDNNDVSNLEWCTHEYNVHYGTAQERAQKALASFRSSERIKELARENGKIVKRPVLQFSKDGKLLARYESGKAASVETGLSHSHIMECCAGKRYKSVGGYIWKYDK